LTENSRIRGIGLSSATALVVANMIGAGVFTTSGFALQDLGRPAFVLLAWVVGGALALLGAMSYAALARRLPESGGEYYYLARTMHPLAGFLAGWVSLLAGFTAPIAVAALTLQVYVAPVLGVAFAPEWIGTGTIVVAFLMHGLKRSRGVWLQNVAVALKLLLLFGFVVTGVAQLPESQPEPDVPFEIGAFAVSLVWISFSYAGWNAATYVAGEVRDPKRNATRALWIGCTIVTALYLALNAVFLYAAPVEAIAGRADIGACAAKALGGDWLWRATSGIVALALLTSISAMMMAGPRVYARMAQDGLFPRRFELRGDTPMLAVALQSLLAIAALWWTGLAALLGYVGLTLSVSTAATVVGLFRLRIREGPAAVPIVGYPWVPGVFVIVTLAAAGFMVHLRPVEAMWGAATVLAGIPLYWWMRRSSSRTRPS
jgi:amino acid transporter